MATGPFYIQQFANASGSVSYRVTGSYRGKRVRKNFIDGAKASAFCNEKNATALLASSQVVQRAVVTSLSPADLAVAESAVANVNWPLREVSEAGLAVLRERSAHASVRVADLIDPFLGDVQAGERWQADLNTRLRAMLRAYPGVTLGELTPAVVRSWLGEGSISVQTRRNRRSVLSRFGSWLVDTGRMSANPCAGVRIPRPGYRPAAPPAVLTAAEAGALLEACAVPEYRHGLGHVVLTLLCGLRPSEAERLTWGEIALERGEIAVLGRKRGSKSRVVTLQAAAVAWLATLDRAEPPGRYFRKTILSAWRDAGLTHSQDICRHTYASMRAASGIPVSQLAAEMGNSERVIHAHYRAAVSPSEAHAFFKLMPSQEITR